MVLRDDAFLRRSAEVQLPDDVAASSARPRAASEAEIGQLPVTTCGPESPLCQGVSCSICLSDFAAGDKLRCLQVR